ncbi:MAG TPA: hypothetical protein VM099_03760 [Gemmatimonadaceae bacterium]|nr:hypothetical protein [Gemmatimonadaceae bacterium]
MTRVLIFVAIVSIVGCSDKKADAGSTPYARQVQDAVPKIEKAVGLKFKSAPRVEVRSKDQVRAFVTQQFRDPQSLREFNGMEAAYKRLGMIPDTLDLKKFLVDLLAEQIVGYYDPKTKVLYIVTGAPAEAASVTITHELVHALQDQYISLDSTQKIEGQNDRQSAAQAVFEGQAVYEQIAAMFGETNVAVNLPGGWDRIRDMIRENQSSMPVFATAPIVIQETLIFPYLSGAEFVRNFKERNAGKMLYTDMPISTEQILHPSAYFARRDAPTDITLPALNGVAMGYQNTLGEFETRLFLFQHLEDQNEAVRGATGWDGDRYALFNTTGGAGIVWVTVWDSPVEASEFLDVMNEVVGRRYGMKSAAVAGAATRIYTGTRSVQITSGEVDGRPVVVYVDAPPGASTNVLDISKVKLTDAVAKAR